jgi:aminoglycoside 2'-N-acetyltransferase I
MDEVPRLLTFRDRLPAHLNWQAVSFIRVAWPWEDSASLRAPNDPAMRPVYFALVSGDRLISHAAVVETELEHAGGRYRVGGLANVFTFPASRAQGHGRRVVEAATSHIVASGVDVAALFCRPERVRFYERSGWRTVPSPSGSDAARMMLFVSARGRAARPAFESEPFRVAREW